MPFLVERRKEVRQRVDTRLCHVQRRGYRQPWMRSSDARLAALLALGACVLYVLVGLGHPTDFDYYGRLADALLHGRWWLTEAPAHLNELQPCGEERWCVVYGAMPALITMPFLAVFDSAAAQTIASQLAGGLAAAPGYLALRAIGTPARTATLVTAFAIAGTTLLFSAADGRAWYMAHAVAVLFSSIALLVALRGGPTWVVGALLAVGALARFPVALAAPGLAIVVSRVRREPLLRCLALLAAGALPFALIEIAYDLARWGVPTEAGYAQLTASDPFFDRGLMSLWYLPRHLYAIFIQAPDFVDGTAFFVRPNWIGESVVLTSPALLLAIAALPLARMRSEIGPLALAAALPLLPDVLHGTVGFAQFGYRFSLDAQPFLLPLVAIGAAWSAGQWRRPGLGFGALVAWSVVANLYGAIAIIQFGYVR